MILYYFQIVLIQIGLETVFAMIRPTVKTVIMMEETAVDMISTLIFALIVNAMSMRLVLLVLILQLVMAFVMMRLTMKTAIMMVESAVALAHRLANVPNVPVLVELMILVTVSPIVSTILISVMGSILVFFTLQIGIDFMINIKSTTLQIS